MSFESLKKTMDRHARVVGFCGYVVSNDDEKCHIVPNTFDRSAGYRVLVNPEVPDAAYIEADFMNNKYGLRKYVDSAIESRVNQLMSSVNLRDSIAVSGLQRVSTNSVPFESTRNVITKGRFGRTKTVAQPITMLRVTKTVAPYIDSDGIQLVAIDHSSLVPGFYYGSQREWLGGRSNTFHLTYALPPSLASDLITQWTEQPQASRDAYLAVMSRFATAPISQTVLSVGWEEANISPSPFTLFDARDLEAQKLYELTMPAGYQYPIEQ